MLHMLGINQVVERIVPASSGRTACFSVMAGAIGFCHGIGPEKWGVRFSRDRVRLQVGSFIAMTVISGEVWMALDQTALDDDPVADHCWRVAAIQQRHCRR